MDILVNLNKIHNICQTVIQHKSIFESFTKVYLFGSILTQDKFPNDVDVLLVYDEISTKILVDSDVICSILCEASGIQVDMTILSLNEFRETQFLCKLNAKYLRIK